MNTTKYIFVTGGVSSSLGKGIIGASLAKLLKKLTYKICLVSPMLHGLNLEINPKQLSEIKKKNLIDAVCTKKKFIKHWY